MDTFATISDLIFHISYTAEYDTDLATAVEQNFEGATNFINDHGELYRALSLKHEFPNELYLAATSGDAKEITVNQEYFPFFAERDSLDIKSSKRSLYDPNDIAAEFRNYQGD